MAGATSQAPPAKRLLGLDRLSPPVAKPTDRPGAAELPDAVRADVLEAERLINQGDFPAARGLLDRAAAQAQDNARIAKDLGMAWIGLGDRHAALEQLRKAAGVAGDDVILHLLIARLQVADAQGEAAIVSLRAALQCSAASPANPLAAEAMLTLAELLAEEGYVTASLDCYAKLYEWIGANGREYLPRPRLRELVLQPARLLTRRGALLMELGRPGEAREVLTSAFRRDRSDDQAAALLMKSLLALKDYAAAEKLLLDLAAEPDARAYLPGLAKMLCQTSGDQAMPLRVWQASRKGNLATGDLAVALAQAAETLKAPQAAKEIADSALAKMPNDVAVGRYIAERLLDEGQVFAALMRLAELLQANDEAAEPVDRLLEDVTAASPPGAQVEAELARQADGQVGQLRYVLYYLAGRLASMRGDLRLAGERYAAAVEDDSTFLPAYDAAVALYLAQEQYDRAGQLAKRLLQHAESDETLACFAHYLDGKSSLARGMVAEAAAALEDSYACDNSFAPTIALLAEVYGRQGRQELAVEALGELVKLLPEDVNSYCRLFDQCVAMGRFAQAGAAASRLAQVGRHEATARAMMAELLLLAGKGSEGVRLVEELRGQDPHNPRVRLVILRLAVGATGGVVARPQFQGWLAELGQVLASGQADLPARHVLAELLGKAGQHDQAAVVLSELHEANPGLAGLTKTYVAALMQSGQLQTAEEVLVNSPNLDEDTQARQWRLEILVRQRRLADAVALLNDWLVRGRSRASQDRYRLQLINVYEELGDFDRAIGLVDDWIAAGLEKEALPTVRAAQVKLLCKAGRYDRAIALTDELIASGQERVPLHLVLAASLGDARQYDRAQGLLDEWIRDDQEGQDLLGQAKVELLARAGEPDQAVAYARAWSARRPADLLPRQAAVAVLADAGQHEKALRLVDEWSARLMVIPATQPATGPAASMPASASRPASRPTSQATRPAVPARTSSATAATVSSTHASTTSGPAAATLPAPQGPGALPARQYASREELAAVRSWCRQTAVRLLLMQARYEDALRRLESYLGGDGRDGELLSLHSSTLTELGRTEEAIAALQKARVLVPDDPMLKNNLGYMYADAGVNLPEAEVMIRQALAARGDSKDMLDSLGWVLYKRGNLPAAGAIFERLLEGGKAIWPGCAVSYDHAGDVFYRLGWVEKAAELWAKAVAVARRETAGGRDIRRILADAPGKIQAVQTGQPPAVAPLAAPGGNPSK